MKRIAVLLLGALCSLGVLADAANAIEIVHGRGRNADYRLAIYEALVQAMSQVEGVSLQDSRDTTLSSFRQSKSVDFDGSKASIDEVKQSLQQAVSAQTKGKVLGYEVTSEIYDEELKIWCIEVDAKVAGQYIVGRDPNNLRRMVVAPFKGNGEIGMKLNDNLTHTRRFTMLDREFDKETMEELNRLYLENSSASDIGRFKQRLITDYMVIGSVTTFNHPGLISNPYTGSKKVADGPCMEVSYRVLLVPTSQLKWADSITIYYSELDYASMDIMLSEAAELAASRICEQIINNIYPIRVTEKTNFDLVLNQGGKNIKVGDIYDVYEEGEDIIDVTTGESLGGAEEMISRIQITRVNAKLSYARVIEGAAISEIPVGAIVRPSTSFRNAPEETNPPPKKQIVHPNGGVKLPWLRK